MTKREFLDELKKALPKREAQERIAFYSEAIDDRIEDGLSEEEAVAAMGSMDDILSDVPPKKKESRSLKAWEILLLVLGAPLWFPILISVVAVIFSVYISVWSVIISLWSVFASLAACALGGIIGGAVLAIVGFKLSGVALVGAALVCAGLAIFAFFGCLAVTKGVVFLTKAIFTRRRAKV